MGRGESVSPEYWRPGWEGYIAGVRVRCVDEEEIPDKVWDHAIVFGSFWAVGRYEQGKLIRHDRMPTDAWLRSGAIKRDGSHLLTKYRFTCLVPVSLLPVVTDNEFGPVSP